MNEVWQALVGLLGIPAILFPVVWWRLRREDRRRAKERLASFDRYAKLLDREQYFTGLVREMEHNIHKQKEALRLRKLRRQAWYPKRPKRGKAGDRRVRS